jgi:hypothetical protein
MLGVEGYSLLTGKQGLIGYLFNQLENGEPGSENRFPGSFGHQRCFRCTAESDRTDYRSQYGSSPIWEIMKSMNTLTLLGRWRVGKYIA